MILIPKKSALAITAMVLGTCLAVGIGQQALSAQGGGVQGGEPKVEDVFKNIKALRGQPAEVLNPTMVFFEASLGVGCPYCHDADGTKRELDSKPQKLIARQMIEMVNTINQNTFRGAKKVTCFTCHEGRNIPLGVPNVTNSELPPALGEDYVATLPPAAPVPQMGVAQVLDKYVAVMGGDALARVAGLDAVGTVTQRRPGRDFPSAQIEIFSKASGMGLSVTKAGQNDNLLSYGGSGGWARAGNTAPRDLRKAEADATRLEDPFNLPVQLKRVLLEPKMEHPEVIGTREVYVVSGHTQNLPLVRAYLEKDSGMLLRLVYFTDTAFGQYPTQIDYRDFRDAGGRKVPYQWVISQTRNREYTYAMQTVKAGAIDDAKFARPAASSR